MTGEHSRIWISLNVLFPPGVRYYSEAPWNTGNIIYGIQSQKMLLKVTEKTSQ